MNTFNGNKKDKRHSGVSIFFFSTWVFFHEHSPTTGLQGKGEGISLVPHPLHRHFHPLHRHIDISRAITAENSPLHIASSRTWTGNLWCLYCWLWTCFTFFIAKFEQENVCFVKYVFKSTLKTLLQLDKNLSKVGRSLKKSITRFIFQKSVKWKCSMKKWHLRHKCFTVKFAKYLRAHILYNTCKWLLLNFN